MRIYVADKGYVMSRKIVRDDEGKYWSLDVKFTDHHMDSEYFPKGSIVEEVALQVGGVVVEG